MVRGGTDRLASLTASWHGATLGGEYWVIGRTVSPHEVYEITLIVTDVYLRFFSRITTSQPMERSTFFVQVAQPGQSLSDILCQLEACSNVDPWMVEAEDILVRRERQTFRKLPKSNAVVFTVKTTIVPLMGLGDEDLLGFARDIISWPSEVATYKGRDVWENCAMEFCKQRLPKGSVEGLLKYAECGSCP